jgi:hypothetical protein
MGVFVIFGNNLNGFWDFYHGTNVGAGLVHTRHQSYQLACTLSFAKALGNNQCCSVSVCGLLWSWFSYWVLGLLILNFEKNNSKSEGTGKEPGYLPLVRTRLGIKSKPVICKFQFRSF